MAKKENDINQKLVANNKNNAEVKNYKKELNSEAVGDKQLQPEEKTASKGERFLRFNFLFTFIVAWACLFIGIIYELWLLIIFGGAGFFIFPLGFIFLKNIDAKEKSVKQDTSNCKKETIIKDKDTRTNKKEATVLGCNVHSSTNAGEKSKNCK